MKKLLIGLVALVVLAVVVLVAAPFFIPVDTYKDQIAERTREATGRELEIRGDFALSLLPRFELVAEDVVFANAPGATEPEMATLKSLLVQLQVWPLLSGEIKVDSFVLIEPVIHLEVDGDGRANWDFGKKHEPRAETAEREAPEDSDLAQISLGDVRLENGLVTYRDARSGQAIEISNINMTLSLPDVDGPVSAEGSLAWNGETVTLTVESGSLRGLMEGATTPLGLDLKSKPIALGYRGSVTKGEPGRIEGDIRLTVPSIRALAAWTGNPIEAGGSGLGPLEIAGKVSAVGPSYAFTGATIALDEMNATGDLSADLGGAKPVVKGRLEVDRIDLNAYLPPEMAGEAKAADAAPESGDAAAGWSEEPLDLSGLKAANVDFDLTVGAIQVQELKIGRSTVAVSLKDGLLVVDLSEFNLYGGSGSGRLSLDGRGEVPAVAKAFAIQGVQAQPLLSDAAGFDRLEGTGQFDISISAKGRSQKAMVEALNGKGAVKFTDGAIKGINLAAMARNVGSAFLDTSARETQKTDFAELSGTFRITKGILRNDDLLLLNPLLRLTGKGSADMPQRTVNYRIEPKVVGTLEGQGGAGDVGGVTVPVIVEGPWHDLQYRPDLAGMITGVVKDPAKALEGVKGTVEQLKEGAGGGLGQILEGVTKQPAEGGEQEGGESGGGGLLSDPGTTLKKLFGN
jgi:AsmA protein